MNRYEVNVVNAVELSMKEGELSEEQLEELYAFLAEESDLSFFDEGLGKLWVRDIVFNDFVKERALPLLLTMAGSGDMVVTVEKGERESFFLVRESFAKFCEEHGIPCTRGTIRAEIVVRRELH